MYIYTPPYNHNGNRLSYRTPTNQLERRHFAQAKMLQLLRASPGHRTLIINIYYIGSVAQTLLLQSTASTMEWLASNQTNQGIPVATIYVTF